MTASIAEFYIRFKFQPKITLCKKNVDLAEEKKTKNKENHFAPDPNQFNFRWTETRSTNAEIAVEATNKNGEY